MIVALVSELTLDQVNVDGRRAGVRGRPHPDTGVEAVLEAAHDVVEQAAPRLPHLRRPGLPQVCSPDEEHGLDEDAEVLDAEGGVARMPGTELQQDGAEGLLDGVEALHRLLHHCHEPGVEQRCVQ